MSSPAPFARRYDLLITYDVDTTSAAGRRRLRQVARLCEGVGQRVQFSVFECRIDETQRDTLQARLIGCMDNQEDSLRIYALQGGREGALFTYGRDSYRDFDEPLVV